MIVKKRFVLLETVKEVVARIENIVHLFRKQNYFMAFVACGPFLDVFSQLIEKLEEEKAWLNAEEELVSQERMAGMLKELFKAQEIRDHVYIADILELMLLPALYRIQEYILGNTDFYGSLDRYEETLQSMREKPEMQAVYQALRERSPAELLSEEGISIEYTRTGAFTAIVKSGEGQFYLHSNSSPDGEAAALAEYWYQEGMAEYCIYGLGLGFHIMALVKTCAYEKITVYESSLGMFCAAAAFGVLKELLSCDNVEIRYDGKLTALNRQAGSLPADAVLYIHYPSLHIMRSTEERERLENYFIQQDSVRIQRKYMDGNFKRNIQKYDAPADILRPFFQNKDVYIIAAGPSLDRNILELKRIWEDDRLRSRSVVTAAGTVFHKLLGLGIRPDYVCFSDAKPGTYRQMQAVQDENIPILCLSTAFYQFFETYRGKKYILFQNGYAPAEQYAKEKGFLLYETGGSVTTVLFDMAARLGGRRIIFLGLDLAYTGGLSHAKETGRVRDADTDSLIQVEGIDGTVIKTGRNLNIYRLWLEKRIKELREIEVIDATEGGAKVHGAAPEKLSDVLDS